MCRVDPLNIHGAEPDPKVLKNTKIILSAVRESCVPALCQTSAKVCGDRGEPLQLSADGLSSSWQSAPGQGQEKLNGTQFTPLTFVSPRHRVFFVKVCDGVRSPELFHEQWVNCSVWVKCDFLTARELIELQKLVPCLPSLSPTAASPCRLTSGMGSLQPHTGQPSDGCALTVPYQPLVGCAPSLAAQRATACPVPGGERQFLPSSHPPALSKGSRVHNWVHAFNNYQSPTPCRFVPFRI